VADIFLQLDICSAEMNRKGFAHESTLQHAQRWIEVVVAVCGANSFTTPSSASSSEQSIKRACVPAVGAPLAVVGDSAAAAARDRKGQDARGDGVQQQPASSGTDAAAASLRSLLQQQQPSMIDRSGKHIGAAAFSSFEEVHQHVLQSWPPATSSMFVVLIAI
jgi:hypothetical protein